EFVEACKPVKRSPYLGVPTTPEKLRLGPPKATDEQRRKYIEHMQTLFSDVKHAEPDSIPRGRYRSANPVLSRGCTCRVEGTCPTCVAWHRLLDGVMAGGGQSA